MASCTPALYLPGRVGRIAVRYLLDSGCTLNILSKRIFNKLPQVTKKSMKPFHCNTGTLADGSGLPIEGQVELDSRLRSEMINVSWVVANIEPDAILGMPFLLGNNCQLFCSNFTLVMNGKTLRCSDRHGVDYTSSVQVVSDVDVPPQSEKLLDCQLSRVINSSVGMVEMSRATVSRGLALASCVVACTKGDRFVVRCLNPQNKTVFIPSGSIIGQCFSVESDQLVETPVECDTGQNSKQGELLSDKPVPEHLENLYREASSICTLTSQQKVIAGLLDRFGDVFSAGDHDMGCTTLVQHSIPIEPGTRPIKQAPRRLGAEKEVEVDKQVKKLIEQDLIEPAQGAWSSPVVLVKKKDGSWRFCIDYRRLNAVTVHDAYPLPRIDESLEALADSQYFSTLDLMSGYWQVPLDEDAKNKSAFCTRGGLWRWKVLPFGLTAAPATFQRTMERVLHGLHWKSVLLYLDDIIVIGKTFEQQCLHLEEVLSRLRAAGLKLKPSKCHIFQQKVKYLGHVVSDAGVSTDPDKIAAVQEWPVPENLTELQSFLGFVGYYRRFVDNFACKARPLTKLTGKNTRFQWSEECQKAFDFLRQSLMTAPVLSYPNPQLEYILDTDASLNGVGAVLSQIQKGEEKVISYYSKALSSAERNYCVTRRELLAIVKAVIHFRPYLYGRRFRIRTDHASLLWLCRKTTPSAQVARWLEILSEFNFGIEHRPGGVHSNADGLSRRPCRDCSQCDRIDRTGGGPSLPDIRKELSDMRTQEDTVVTDIIGEQLYGASDFGSHYDNPSNECHSVLQEKARDGSLVCPVNGDNLQDSGEEQVSLPLPTPDSTETNLVLSGAQKEQGEVSTVYKAVDDQVAIDASIVNLGSWELRKLNSMMSLMRIRDDGVLVVRILNGQRTKEVIVCPKTLRKDLIWSTHTLSHSGRTKTLKRLRLTWYWPGMTADVRRLLRTCEICQRAKSGGLLPSSRAGPLWVGRPWQKVAIDLVGPLPETLRGNKWVLVLTDHFTRWQDALPLSDATAPVVAEALDSRVFCYFGLPEELHSDRGSQFEGELMTELCRFWRITKTRTTPYHPQSNGVVERGNRTLGDSLRSMLLSSGQEQNNWDCLLPQIMRALRATPHSKTEETSNFLMFGRECRLPDQLIGGTYSCELNTRLEYAQRLKERLESAHDLLRSQQSLLMRWPDSDEEPLFKPGELVLVQRKRKKKGVNPKLLPKFEGPFFIRKSFNNGTYKIDGRGVVNECRLKLFVPCADADGRQTPHLGQTTHQSILEYTDEPDNRSVHSDLAGDPVVPEPVLPTGRLGRTRRRPRHLFDYTLY